MINFSCACGQPMSVQDSFAGRQGNCPRCKQPFTVPAPAAAPAPAPAPPLSKATQPMSGGPLAAAGGAAPSIPTSGARLEVVHGPEGVMGQVYPLLAGRVSVLGRDPGADITVASDRVSRRHCRFEAQGSGNFLLVDMGSANGTLVNQNRIDGRKLLHGGEYIQAGDCLFRYCER